MRLHHASLCRAASLPLLLIALTVPPSAVAQTLRRDDVMAAAAKYAEHSWEMGAANQKGTCQGEYRSDHTVGKQTGVPYAWGGWMDLAEFDRRIAAGAGAGSHSKDGILSCVAGVDCSGFVSQVWRLKDRQSTSTLASVTRPIKLDELRPGDALNKAGKHVVLWAGSTADGKPVIYEASGSASRVRLATPGWSYLNGYQPVRYTAIEDPPAVASTTLPTTPAPAPAPAKTTPAANASATVVPASASTASSAQAAVVPASTSTASNAQAATAPATAAVPSSAPAAAAKAPSSAVPSVPAPTIVRRSLRYGVDVGFQPASEDAHAIGPDHLTAGPKGMIALHDRVRGKVLVLARDGAPKEFAAGQVDGLGFGPQGNIIVVDRSLRELRLYRPSGELMSKFGIPREGPLGAISFEDGVLYATASDGKRKALVEFSGGKPRPSTKNMELSKDQLLALKKVDGGQLIQVGGESLVVPEKVRISARPLGPWMELVIAATAADGSVNVNRSLRRPGQLVPLPDGTRGAYSPMGDLAISSEGKVVYLEPGEKELTVAWVDPS